MIRNAMSFAVFATTLALTLPAQAQNGSLTRSFVSSAGVDTNPCTITQPCATFARAYTMVGANGIIAALDPGKYGALTITGPVTINGNGWAAITALPGGNSAGIAVNAGSNDSVVLTGLEIDGAGVAFYGILFNTGAELIVQDCLIRNFGAALGTGIWINPTATGGSLNFVISNTIISDNKSAGISYNPYPFSTNINANGVIDHVTVTSSNQGILFDTINDSGNVYVTISNSITSNNSDAGMNFVNSGAQQLNLIATVDSSYMSNNGTGIAAGDTAKVLLSRSFVTGNKTGVTNGVTSNTFYTYGDNRINGNYMTDVDNPLNTSFKPQ